MFKVNSASALMAATSKLFKVEKKTLKPIPEKVKNVYGAKGPKET